MSFNNPGEPTKKEREEHDLTHIPYRSWCYHCVSGRGKEHPHFEDKHGEKEDRVPVVAMDYCYLGSEGQEGVPPTLVMKCAKSKAIFSHRCEQKGPALEWIVKRVVRDLGILGWSKVVLKCDQEPSIVALQNAVIAERSGQVVAAGAPGPEATIPENSKAYDHQSNGLAERGVQEVQGIARTVKHHIEYKLGITINYDHPIIAWMTEHVSTLFNRYTVGRDGRTPYERLKGKQSSIRMPPFAEKVLYKFQGEISHMPKLEPRWSEGVFLGVNGRTDEYIIGTPTGTVKARSIQRVPDSEKWDRKAVEGVKYFP